MQSASDSFVQTERGGSYYYLGASTETNIDLCLLCILRNDGSNQAMLEV